MILDEERLRSERSDRKTWKSRVSGIEEFGQSSDQSQSRPPPRGANRPHRAQRDDEEDHEYQLALEASKFQEEEDERRRKGRPAPDDDDLAKAIKLSQEEEELRRRELEERNATSLFDDDPIQTAQPTGFNQGYQQQGAVDWSGNPIDQSMQSQPTGYPNNVYANQTGFQPQPTGFQTQPTGYQQNGFGSQPTGFDPYGQQAQQSFQPQATGYNPYAQQAATPFQAQPTQQAEPATPAGTNNPWATNHQQQPLKATPTGSNNPFAQSYGQQQQHPPMPSKPTLQTLSEQKTLGQFNSTPSFPAPNTVAQQPPPQEDTHEARLNALLASGEGMDTFGNTGNLRIPAQHTAPGTFVNSAGAGLGRIHENQTGNNPFLNSQFTGVPQTQYGAAPFGAAGHQMPAATGPAGFSNGYGASVPPVPQIPAQHNNNPFGAAPHPQQGQTGPNGDLIHF